MKPSRLILPATLIAFAACATSDTSRQPSEQTVPADPPAPAVVDLEDVMEPPLYLDAPLPLDTNVTTGTLPNGLQYYIRQNAKPENRAELRLAVNAGSILEHDDQRGLAHFAEHMAFNGTEKYAEQELIDYLELTGTRFGPDLNAYTSFDETVYILQVRTDSLEILDTGLEILREWAGNVSFDPDEIEKERGVVLEEWRLGRGASARILDEQLPVLLSGSHYAERLPIGDPEILQSFQHERLTAFYNSWYRPDLMSVVVVGDVDVDRIEAKLKSLFGDLDAENGPQRISYDVPDHDSTLVTIATDPESPYSTASIVYKHPVHEFQLVKDFRTQVVEQLFSNMFNNRLDELRQQATPPFIVAGAGRGAYVRSKDFYNVNAIVQEGGYIDGISALLTEVDRIRQFGFTDTEMQREKLAYERWYESAYNERDKTESDVYAAEYVRNYLENEAIPGIAYEFDLVKRLLPTITLDEVNREADKWLTTTNRVVMLSGPSTESAQPPSKETLLSLIDEIAGLDLVPYDDVQSTDPILPHEPPIGKVVEESADPDVGTTRLTLSNGATVVLKETDFKNDEILFAAYSSGGTSLYPQELDTPGDFASTLIGQSGVGSYDPIALNKQLSDKVVSIQPSIGEMSESMTGSAAPQDFEILMQLVHGFFAYPRADSTAYQSYVNRISSLVESFKVDPNRAFFDTLSTTLSQHHPRRRVVTGDVIDEMDLQKSLTIYRERFADASDFTFYFVGAFETDEIKPVIEKYIASLPATNSAESWRDLGVEPPDGVVKKTVYRGIEEQSRVQLVFTGDAEWSLHNRRLISALGSVLDIRLREILREDLGGTYGVRVGGSISRYPDSRYSVSIGFGCDPARTDELIDSVMENLRELKDNAPDQEYVDKVRETLLNGYEQGLKQNTNWLQWLQFYDRNGLDPSQILTGIPDFAASLTPAMIQETAQRYLDDSNYVQVVLLPESAEGSE